jgi:glucan 1,3-beta-glucosidase
MIGNANSPPTIKAAANFAGGWVIDGDPYFSPEQNWGSTTVFYRQFRNFIIDTTAVPASTAISGMHWPTAQATSVQFVTFNMASGASSKHQGLFIENGSAGFVSDLTFNGGMVGMAVGNQQFTMRAITFNNCQTAIKIGFAWGWTFAGVKINNCGVGLDMTNVDGNGAQLVASITFFDSTISNTPTGFLVSSSTTPAAGGSLQIEKVQINNVPNIVKNSAGAVLYKGTTGSATIAAWAKGNQYVLDQSGPVKIQQNITPFPRPATLLVGSAYRTQSKPQYNTLPVSSFASVRSAGAKGDGVTDDTAALQSILNSATNAGKVVFFDAGTYRVTSTLTFPQGARVVGESYSVIMSSGNFFNDAANPKPVVKLGNAGNNGQHIEWSDMIVSTQGQQRGAILIEYNMNNNGGPTGLWDVHIRVGGFAGSKLTSNECTKNTGQTSANQNCIGAYMLFHATAGSQGLYMENNWFWVADHDIDTGIQIDVYSGRGYYSEASAGRQWLWGTAVEHNALYQYQFANTQNVFLGFAQTETPYYQPNPPAPSPFTVNTAINDPNFAVSCKGQGGTCADAWGLRLINAKNINIYGLGLYSFFNNWSTTCSNPAGGGAGNCQNSIMSIEGSTTNLYVFGYSSVGTVYMITKNGGVVATASRNPAGFSQTVSVFRSS